MNQNNIKIKRALISVSDKTGVVEFARGLAAEKIEIISTGGTAHLLREANIPVMEVADITHFPEIMDGRVKTLHPKIHGGILGQRDLHEAAAVAHEIQWIDLVVVNLYPFAETIKKSNVTFDEAVENIDIGGPTMIRSAAKNMGWVGVIVDPLDYSNVLAELKEGLSFATRKNLAIKAFAHTAHYDHVIHHYFNPLPESFSAQYEKINDLRYGENPHQKAAAYRLVHECTGVLSAKQHQGKQLSYNNMTDAEAAVACISDYSEPASAIIKHANPCGVALGETISDAFKKALAADPISAFGGILALNRICDEETAAAMTPIFFELIIAPGYTPEALFLLSKKPNLRVLEYGNLQQDSHELKFITGGLLIQEKDQSVIHLDDLKVVTKRHPSDEEMATLLFTWPVLKQMKSNAILIAKERVTVGIGVGQVSRIDAVEIALKKGQDLQGAVLASDAFFPFRDSIDRIAGSGIRAILQPGGSMRDEEVIQACNEHGIAMVFTGMRCFKH